MRCNRTFFWIAVLVIPIFNELFDPNSIFLMPYPQPNSFRVPPRGGFTLGILWNFERECSFGISLSENYWRSNPKPKSTFLNNMGSEIVSLGVWGFNEIIYHYDLISSSTLFRSMKICTRRYEVIVVDNFRWTPKHQEKLFLIQYCLEMLNRVALKIG